MSRSKCASGASPACLLSRAAPLQKDQMPVMSGGGWGWGWGGEVAGDHEQCG